MQHVVGPMAQAGNSLWQSTPPEQRGEMIRDSMKVAKGYGGGLMAAPPPAPATAPRNYLPELKALAARLAKDYNVGIEVEPTLFLAAPPATQKEASIEKALAASIAHYRDVTWRRVHLARSQEAIPTAGELATEVRLWESSGASLSADAGAVKKAAFRSLSGSQEMEKGVKELGEGSETIYLIYGVTDHHSLSPAARFAELLRRQMDQMVRMTPDEMTNTLSSAVQDYQTSGTASRREKIMALPSLAGMMAVWFPKAAQEKSLPPP
jgi:hypothetical protein